MSSFSLIQINPSFNLTLLTSNSRLLLSALFICNRVQEMTVRKGIFYFFFDEFLNLILVL